MTGPPAWRLLLDGVLELLPRLPEVSLGLVDAALGLEPRVADRLADLLLDLAHDFPGLAGRLVPGSHDDSSLIQLRELSGNYTGEQPGAAHSSRAASFSRSWPARARPYRRRPRPAHGSDWPSRSRRSPKVPNVNRPGVRPGSSSSSQRSGVATCAPGRARTV